MQRFVTLDAVLSLAVSDARRQEQFMARFPLFFISTLLVMVAMIGVTLLPLKATPAFAVEARMDQGTLIVDGAALANIKPSTGFPVTNAPGPRNDQKGPRLANFSALAPDAKHSKGARLVLGPKTQAALSGKAFSVIITARGVANSPAQTLGFGLVTGGPITWGQIAVTPNFSPLRFDIPASKQPLEGVALWPAVEGQGHGIEITSIAFQPLIPPQGNP